MAYTAISNISISLQTQAVTQVGFGIPLFITANAWFKERVRVYTDIESVAGDVPTTSNAYIGAAAMFAQNPAPAQIMLGRRDAGSVDCTPAAATAIGQVYTISVTGTDDVKVDASFTTTTGSETATAIATALVTALGTPTGVTVVDNTGSLSLTKSGVDDFSVSGVALITVQHAPTEVAADTLTAIQEENDDFYFVTAEDKSQAWVLAMAAAVEPAKKFYAVATNDASSIAALSEPVNAADTLGKLADLGYIQSAGLFYDDNNAFFECGAVAKGAPYRAGTITWDNQRIAGFTDTKDPATGKSLSVTQKNNLVARNAGFTEDVGGLTITRNFKVAGGEWWDVVRSKDFLIARLTEAYQNKLINSLKVTYDNIGINEMKSVMTSVLDRYVTEEGKPDILQSQNPYTVSFPQAKDVSFGDKSSRTLNASFTGFLAGAIHVVNVQGILTLDANS